ncbi:protein CURVATURE THYLAKOID 1B chloroplastic isoform X1 [Tripterygium wilfordii]|uniref:Protein CURVATURE THYLAKOID 1B chloroplastic isoform X1 n=1 Tax=Tripterygium wilfordii TaxID=458696 RepID=A0A7J7CH58_TRIWF|nr:protein CURVATURE THYLAKOID 1B, chloroplastic-like [Tripterygium wilfordii]KAF5733390.1 protein CURVATURE THYLAKOID 1B chloroplastic isoform X1 [Tripterygium wilfordii]
MASTSSTTLFISSSSAFVDAKAPRQTSAASPQCVTLPTLPPPPPIQFHNRASKTTSYCRKISRNVRAMATGEAPAEVAGTELPDVELPDVAKTIQEAWDKLDDKYAVTSLVVAGVVALWVFTGMISAIDRLPLVPGVLELVGIGYTGWFAYKNLIFKPEREELIEKIKDTYKNVIGTS